MTPQFEFAPGFPVERLTFSETAERLGINNELPPNLYGNAVELSWMLETAESLLGEQWGSPLILTSAYRCPALNARIGGVPTSAHTQALAADIKAVGVSPQALAGFLADRFAGHFDQIIHEFTWVHIGLPQPGTPGRCQLLTAQKQNGRIVYREGLV